MQPPSLKWTPIALMYISHYTWPKVISTKQDKSKEPEEPGVPRCARSVPVVPWCVHMCRGCTPGCTTPVPQLCHSCAHSVPRLHHGCTTHVPRLYPWCSWQEMCQEGKRGSCCSSPSTPGSLPKNPHNLKNPKQPPTTAGAKQPKHTHHLEPEKQTNNNI